MRIPSQSIRLAAAIRASYQQLMQRVFRALEDAPAPPSGPRPLVASYLLGALAIVLGAAARIALDPWLGDRAAFWFFMPALLATAATGGWAPTLAASLIATLLSEALLARHPLVAADQIDAGLFLTLSLVIGLAGAHLRRVRSDSAEMRRRVADRQAHLQSIVDTAPDAMLIIDVAGLVQSFSPAAERLFGWTTEEVLGRNVSLLMPQDHAIAHDNYLARYLQTGERRIIGRPREVIAQHKNGEQFPVQLFVGESEAAGARFFTGFIHDLRARMAAENRVQGLQAELIHTSRLSALGEMAAALAHELNQPLSAISNYLKGGRRLLLDENPGSRALEALDKAADQSLRAGEIIRRLRAFVATGESQREVESLKALIEETAVLGLVGAREAGVRVQTRWDAEVDRVVVDRIQIQQVMLNLLRNALEAMEDSTLRELEIATERGETGMAMVTVRDTGPGISPVIAERLFQPFTTTKQSRGMGVGLSICRSIIEAHDGRIWVEPNLPKGAAFHFTVPRASHGESGAVQGDRL